MTAVKKHNYLVEGRRIWSRLGKKFLSLFLLAAALPVVLSLVLNQDALTFLSRADQKAELRLWLEPNTVLTKPNEPVTLRVVAEYTNGNQLLTELRVGLYSETSLEINPTQVTVTNPFRGRQTIASVVVTPRNSGTFSVSVSNDMVKANNTQLANVITSPATVIVKE